MAKTVFGCGEPACHSCEALARELDPRPHETFAEVLVRAAGKSVFDDKYSVVFFAPELLKPVSISVGFVREALDRGGPEALRAVLDMVFLSAGPTAQA